MKIIEKIIKDFTYTPDLVIREIKKGNHLMYILYLETVSSSEKVNNYILRNIANSPKNRYRVEELFSGPNLKEIEYVDIENNLCNGFTIIIDAKKVYAFETKADLDRSISPTDTESGLYSPKDSLVENYQKNIGLIKRRIKTKDLKTIDNNIGRYTKTQVGLLYVDSIAKKELVDECLKKLKNIDTEGILASGDLKQYLIKENKNVFPSIQLTERPDNIVKALMEGKIVLIVDTSPFALIIPSFFADFINPNTDDYSTGINVNFLKFLRIICLILTITLPAFYIALTNFNPESIPTKLMMNIAFQRFNVPFSSIVEALIMLFICEILRESDLRFQSNYGSAISIMGALILGESAVSAGIASPIMIIIIALTFISSLMFNDLAMNSALRAWRYCFLIVAAFLGIYGIGLVSLFLLVNLCSYQIFNMPYMFPIAPLDIAYLKQTLFKSSKKNHQFRSSLLTNNIRKQR